MININFFAIVNESAGKKFLQYLSNNKISLKGICFDKKSIYKNYFINYAKINQINYFYYDQIKSDCFKDFIKTYSIDYLLNIYGTCIIPNNVIKILKNRCFNLHPGILPYYAGLNPLSWSIYDNQTNHGVTVHQITNKIDFGPIFSVKKFPITKKDTTFSLMVKCVNFGLPIIYQLIFKIQNNKNLSLKMQNPNKFNYHDKLTPNNCFLNPALSANKNYLLFRASIFSFNTKAWTYPKISINNKLYFITSLKIGNYSKSLIGSYKINANSKLMFKVKDKWLILDIIYRNKKYFEDVKHINIANVKAR